MPNFQDQLELLVRRNHFDKYKKLVGRKLENYAEGNQQKQIKELLVLVGKQLNNHRQLINENWFRSTYYQFFSKKIVQVVCKKKLVVDQTIFEFIVWRYVAYGHMYLEHSMKIDELLDLLTELLDFILLQKELCQKELIDYQKIFHEIMEIFSMINNFLFVHPLNIESICQKEEMILDKIFKNTQNETLKLRIKFQRIIKQIDCAKRFNDQVYYSLSDPFRISVQKELQLLIEKKEIIHAESLPEFDQMGYIIESGLRLQAVVSAAHIFDPMLKQEVALEKLYQNVYIVAHKYGYSKGIDFDLLNNFIPEVFLNKNYLISKVFLNKSYYNLASSQIGDIQDIEKFLYEFFQLIKQGDFDCKKTALFSALYPLFHEKFLKNDIDISHYTNFISFSAIFAFKCRHIQFFNFILKYFENSLDEGNLKIARKNKLFIALMDLRDLLIKMDQNKMESKALNDSLNKMYDVFFDLEILWIMFGLKEFYFNRKIQHMLEEKNSECLSKNLTDTAEELDKYLIETSVNKDHTIYMDHIINLQCDFLLGLNNIISFNFLASTESIQNTLKDIVNNIKILVDILEIETNGLFTDQFNAMQSIMKILISCSEKRLVDEKEQHINNLISTVPPSQSKCKNKTRKKNRTEEKIDFNYPILDPKSAINESSLEKEMLPIKTVMLHTEAFHLLEKCAEKNNSEIVIFGGCPRDILLGYESILIEDLDLIWNRSSDEVLKYISWENLFAKKSKMAEVDLITMRINQEKIDIVCKPHFSLKEKDLLAHAYSCDFTIHTFILSYDKKSKQFLMYAPLTIAVSHLESKWLVPVDEKTFFNDPKRIWRGIEKIIKLGFDFTEDFKGKIRSYLLNHGNIFKKESNSQYYLRSLFSQPKLKDAFLLLDAFDILPIFFPNLANILAKNSDCKEFLLKALEKLSDRKEINKTDSLYEVICIFTRIPDMKNSMKETFSVNLEVKKAFGWTTTYRPSGDSFKNFQGNLFSHSNLSSRKSNLTIEGNNKLK